MKKQRRNSKPTNLIALRMWTLETAHQAVPYFRSLQNSIRDIWIDFRQAERIHNKLQQRSEKPDRDALIALDDSNADLARFEKQLEEISTEMIAQSLYCVDPVTGISAVPFMKDQQLAWFIVDLFDENGISTWRLHTDPLDRRRTLPELEQPVAPPPESE